MVVDLVDGVIHRAGQGSKETNACDGWYRERSSKKIVVCGRKWIAGLAQRSASTGAMWVNPCGLKL